MAEEQQLATTPLFILFIVLTIILAGCGGRKAVNEYGLEVEAVDGTAASAGTVSSGLSNASAGGYSSSATQLSQSPARINRKIYYNGSIESQSTSPDEVIEKAIGITIEYGGHVEKRSNFFLIVRVPVDNFQLVLDQFAGLAEVLRQDIRAEDITDRYFDRELRLKTSLVTRNRLIELLALATEEEEKIKLLAEIQRLNREIEILGSEVQTLQSLASLSKITFNVRPRQVFKRNRVINEDAGFGWINSLTPFKLPNNLKQSALAIEVPEKMVELEQTSYWIAESADGSYLRSYQLVNNPEGDTAFWRSAIVHRIRSEFASMSQLTAGGYEILRFESADSEPYIYWVGVKSSGTKIDILDAYFPSAEDESRYAEFIKTSLGGNQ